MNEEQIVRLTKPRKKGILGLVFSRFSIILILLVAQALLYVAVFLWLSQYAYIFYLVTLLFTVVMLVYLFMCGMDNSAKLTWLLIIAVLPLAGSVMLLFTQSNFGHRKLKEWTEKAIRESKDMIPQPDGVLEELKQTDEDIDNLVTYLNRGNCFPAYKNTDVRYFPLGEEKFAAMLEELKKAEHFIFMEYFIIEEGYMWGKILEILLEKVAAGVEVRVMYDGMCEMSTLQPDYWKILEKHGIQSRPLAPIQPILSTYYNYRDHRKILVIDGKVAFTGGVNLADEYINRKERFGHWKDTAIMLRGEAAKSFTLLFLQMWNTGEKEPEYLSYLQNTQKVPAKGYVIPYGFCPLSGEKVGENVYLNVLNHAEKYVHIMTPYLILDGELETALRYAAMSGVDVKLILPGIPDKKGAYSLAKTHYRSLVAAGVQIFEYTPGFVHAKVVVSDDKKAVVGTINMDYRSLYHHFECAAFMYRTSCIPDIEKDFQDTLTRCCKVTPETIKNEKLYYKCMGVIMKFIAPLI